MALTKVSFSMIDAAPINVADYGATGDGITDDTVAIQAAFDAVSAFGGTVVFEPGKTYMINGLYQPIQSIFGGVVPKSGTVIQGNRATLKVIPNSSIGYCVLRIDRVNSIVVNDLNIVGDVGSHTGTTGEFGHGIMLIECSNVQLNNLFVTLCWGDGMLVVDAVNPVGSVDVEVNNCEFVDCRRQGVSILSMKNATFTSCTFRNIGATAATSPASGVDIEPDYVGAAVTNVSFIHCTFNNNSNGHGFLVGSIGSANVVENIKLIGCSFFKNGASAITADSVGGVARVSGGFELIGCDIKGQAVVENCTIIGGQITLEEIYTNTNYAVASNDDLPFKMIGTSIFVTGTRRATSIRGATSENTRKLVSNCKINQDNNLLPDLETWNVMGGFITVENTQMTRTGLSPATAYTFLGAADFNGFEGKMVNCYLDPKLANGFAQDQLMNRVALRGWASAAPTTGAHLVGEIVFNSAPTSGGFIGWVCTVAGTPGTWQTFGLIS
jgi:hypothetical protein